MALKKGKTLLESTEILQNAVDKLSKEFNDLFLPKIEKIVKWLNDIIVYLFPNIQENYPKKITMKGD